MEDVRKHPALSGVFQNIEKFYHALDLNPKEETFSDGEINSSLSLKVPKSVADLSAKRRAYYRAARISNGLIGRTPDFMNAAIAAMSAHSEFLGIGDFTDYGANARTYFEHCLSDNPFVCHGAINPQVDRSKSVGDVEHDFAGVRTVSYNEHYVTVSGAKMIVTLAPIANEILVFNMPGLKPSDEDYAIAFAIPLDTEGVKIICRNSTLRNRDFQFDRPLANDFDEIDALVTFESVEVPWNRVFVFRDVEKSNAFFDGLKIRNHSGHQGIVRGLAKLEFVSSIAMKIANVLGLDVHLPVQQKLGELTSYIDLTKAAISQSEALAEIDAYGVANPDSGVIQALRLQFPKWYQTAVTTIQELCSGSMMSVPSERDLHGENEHLLDAVLSSGSYTSIEKACLLNLAWDVTGNDFGQRQLVYEMSHSGSQMVIATGHFRNFQKETLFGQLDAFLPRAQVS